MDSEAVYIQRAFILLSDSWIAYHVYPALQHTKRGDGGGETIERFLSR